MVWAAVCIGLFVAVLGLVDGVLMALKRHVAPCPYGKELPQGTTDFNCYIHPHAGVGVAIGVFSVLLGIVLVLSGVCAAALFRNESAVRR